MCSDEFLYSAAYFCRIESAFEEMYLCGLRATRPDAPIFVYIVSVMNLSRRQATMISSEIGESFERSVAASRRWCTLIVAEDCLFIVVIS